MTAAINRVEIPDGYKVERVDGRGYRYVAPNGDVGKSVRSAEIAANQADKHHTQNKDVIDRNCLKCKAPFQAPNKFIRLCNTCKSGIGSGMI